MTNQTHYRAVIPAKINLSLVVTGKRDGLHTLDMIVCPCHAYCDEVTFVPRKNASDVRLFCTAGFAGFDEERFKKFAQSKTDAVATRLGVGGDLYVTKNIPLGAGLGGSSAVIVGALKAMSDCARDLGKSVRLDDGFLLSLGSDVPCMSQGGICRVQGVGEKIETLGCDKTLDFEIVVADGGADSKECYALFDKTCEINPSGAPETVEEAVERCRNDLFAPACALNPNIKEAYDALKKKGCEHVVMTGSGSAVVAVRFV